MLFKLWENPKCSICPCVLQLERDAADVLHLEATFEPSVAYCVWYNFRQMKVLREENLCIMWQSAVIAFCKQQVTNAQLSVLLAASPHAVPAKSTEVYPLLLLQHFFKLNATAAIGVDAPSSHSRPQQSASQIGTGPLTFLWGSLEDVSAPKDALARSFQQYALAMTGPEAHKLSHVVLVRSALLLVHLLVLVKMIAPGIGAVEGALWSTVGMIGEQMNKRNTAPAADGDAAQAEEEDLSLKLAALLMPTLRSSVKGSGRRAALCCEVLVGLMPRSKPSLLRAVSSELLKLGEWHVCCSLAGLPMFCLMQGGHLSRGNPMMTPVSCV